MELQTTKQAQRSIKFPGIITRGHYFDVPLDYSRSRGSTIKVFAREIISSANETAQALPWLIFLQGGPGFPSPRPEGAAGWIKRALQNYRVLLLDQRGTGLSTPVTHQTLASIAEPQKQMDYLLHFRADNIVRDCETIRKSLAESKPWTVLGQSFGGFCITTYLSQASEGLSAAILTGGLPPLVDQPDAVYRATYKQLIDKNKLYYDRFPDDVELVRRIVKHLQTNEIVLPCGEILTARRFLQLGIGLGFTAAGTGINTIHYLLEKAFVNAESAETISYAFLRGIENMLDFNTNPIYALLHEAIYCQKQASNWSAERILAEYPEFDLNNNPIYFTGEMVYSWMFDEYSCLRPLKHAAQLLAEYSDWPEIYNVDSLRQNTVPCAASIYYNDMYVDRQFAEETARTISGIKVWITNEFEHDGLRVEGEKVLEHLLALLQ